MLFSISLLTEGQQGRGWKKIIKETTTHPPGPSKMYLRKCTFQGKQITVSDLSNGITMLVRMHGSYVFKAS